ncbi:DUF5696 domain-containing protein [Paenibacillus sp. ATY16]|uniref:DUF5696 domain-containing protein n=1 Tax=Paenibacillus sp. ATY16 TaxID=1759312 RepID=UPI00200FE83F|nr:DUF5696 domain-containing protein [Paenibacillus sp. ATY16]MCK9862148.1 DUF5696 domain-containing protein [Paenibacillus sp. ATY16]
MKRLLQHMPLRIWLQLLLVVGLAAFIVTHLQVQTLDREEPTVQAEAKPRAVKAGKGQEELPIEANFQTVSENEHYRLKLDPETAHFLVEDKRDGRIWRSYPDPTQWADETTMGSWRTNLRSPVMFQYIDLNASKAQPKDSNFLDEDSKISNLHKIDGGFRLTFTMPSKQIAIPIEVKLENDSVTTRIIDSELQEGSLSLLWIRLYPFFGAERSVGQDGYLFIPDGSGALINFDPYRTSGTQIYREPVYGADPAYTVNSSYDSRQRVATPVYGIKNNQTSFLAVLEGGSEYSEVLASPAGALSSYNWATSQADYRSSYQQVTNRDKGKFYITYDKDNRFHGDRITRYLLLESTKADYVGMAERYRQYLMETEHLEPIKTAADKVPMNIVLVGGDKAPGLLWDRYIKGTTTNQAMEITKQLYQLGIEHMQVLYRGWQKGGIGASGGLAKVDQRLGGDKGMKQFINYAHSIHVPVYLTADYSQNTTGAGGFTSRRQGVRDYGGTTIGDLASLKFVNDTIIDKDIKYYQSLGIDGVELDGIGQFLSSDYNSKYGSTRAENLIMQQDMIKKLKDSVGKVIGYESNLYALPWLDGIARLNEDYSYDLFSNAAIPFLQIALHGLVPYTSVASNDRDQFHLEFLHDLEYGANPSYTFTYTASEEWKDAEHLHLFSPAYRVWGQTAAQEYKEWNEALGDVQDQFIVGHRILSDQVRETTYSGGKRIVVNYGTIAYTHGDVTVPPGGYAIVKGGTNE